MQTKTLFQRSLIAIATATLIATLPAMGHQAQQPQMKKILKQLNLNDQQRSQVRTLIKQSKADAQTIRQDLKLLNQQLKSAIQAQYWNEEVVKTLILQKQAARQELALTRATSQHIMWNQLDNQQQEKFETLVDSRQNRQRNKSAMRRFEPLNLSDEQYVEIEALINRQKAQSEEKRKLTKPFKMQQKELVQSTDFDQQAWLTSHQAMQNMQTEVAIDLAQTRHKIWNILDAEQQSTLQDMTEKRQQKRQDKQRRMEQRKGRI